MRGVWDSGIAGSAGIWRRRRRHADHGLRTGSAGIRLQRQRISLLFERAHVDNGDSVDGVRHRRAETPVLAETNQWRVDRPALHDRARFGFGRLQPEDSGRTQSLKTRAERKGDRYVINGSKTFITNTIYGDLFIVFANVDPSKGANGVTGFLI